MKTAICVIIKDEHQYLKEWLDYHFSLGFDDIFLFEDYDSKSHYEITKEYGDKVHLQSIGVIIKNEEEKQRLKREVGSAFQNALFNWFPIKYKGKFDWVLFNDIDEFLILKQPLHDLLKEYEDRPAILLSWKYYGASGHITKPEGKVMDNFTKQSPTSFDFHWQLKSFANLNKYTKWEKCIHKIEGGVYPLTQFGDHKAWLNHYFTKSWEEWKEKLLVRGDTCPGNRKIHQFFLLNPDMNELNEKLISEIEWNKK